MSAGVLRPEKSGTSARPNADQGYGRSQGKHGKRNGHCIGRPGGWAPIKRLLGYTRWLVSPNAWPPPGPGIAEGGL